MTSIPSWEVPRFHPWDVQIDNHTFLAKLSCLSDDFATYNTLLATSVEGAIDYTTTLNSYSPGSSAADTLKSYNTATVQTTQTAYNTFAGTVSNLSTQTVDQEAWSKTIDDAAQAAKDAASAAIDKAAKNAKDYIKTLPEGSRAPAATLFIAGVKVALNFLSTVWMKIKEVAQALVQYLEGLWDVLTQATAAILAAAKLAIAYIKGGTSSSTSAIASVRIEKVHLQQLRSKPETYNVVVPAIKGALPPPR
ncbi:MAG: hypothetical protein M1839_005689 [Geoglossum umbratile]|nr:MAG: hypothetical protein M1839_005689 [Geoglossum umbratile]